jgi:hypothetical protein
MTMTLRPIYAFNVSDLMPIPSPATGEPIFEDVDPLTLFVDPIYQRDIGERGVKQIRRMVAAWDWSKFRAPVCAYAEDDDGKTVLKVIDGQHTAIAAASHPHIGTIPVQIVEAPDQQTQAAAFIGQNTDRLNVTKLQLHQAAIAAGDEDAMTIQKVCDRAGVRMLLTNNGSYEPGDTVAITAVASLLGHHSAMKARQILEVLAKAKLAPIATPHIKAAELLMTDADYCDQFEPDDLTREIEVSGKTAEHEAKLFAAAHCVPLWRALAITWFKKTRKKRKVAA